MTKHPMRWRSVFLAVLVASLAGAVPVSRPKAAPLQGIRGTYGFPKVWVDSAGVEHVDTALTIERLQAMHANTYAFVIREEKDWDDLRLDFLPAAEQAGIRVWVYLLPPSLIDSEYGPYREDYVAWGEAIASLAVQYPTLTAWGMDDFNANVDVFTPTYVREMQEAAKAIQPSLDFYATVYSHAITQSFVDRYGSIIDAVVLPFNDRPSRNTVWTGTLRSHLDQAIALLGQRGRPVILMVYARGVSKTKVRPDVDYVRRVTKVGIEYAMAGKIPGVIQYGLPLTIGRPQALDGNRSHSPGYGAVLFSVNPEKATSAGAHADAFTTIRLDSGSPTCRMIAWHRDNRSPPSHTGYHFKQALVNGILLWEQDVASDDTDWHTTPLLDLSPFLQGTGSATLTFRLFERQGVSNYQVVASIDDVMLDGCHIANPDLETVGGWSFGRTGDYPVPGQHIYDPVYSTTVRDMVGAFYAAYEDAPPPPPPPPPSDGGCPSGWICCEPGPGSCRLCRPAGSQCP